MEAHDHNGEHQPDLKLLVRRYEGMLLEGGVSFLETDSFLMLIDYYEEVNNNKLALNTLVHALEQHPFSTTLYIRKAQLLCEETFYQQALKALDRAVVYSPSDLDIYLTKADIYLRMEAYSKALHTLSRSKEVAEGIDLADIYILESTIFETQKEYLKAIKSLKLALKYDPKNDIALNKIWCIYDLTFEYSKSIDFHTAFIDKHPYSYWAWFNLGMSYSNVGMLEKAAEAFDYSIIINEKFEPAYHYYIDVLIGLESFDLALRYLDEYGQFFETDAQILFQKGQCYEFKQLYKDAIFYYGKALKIDNINGRVYHSIGNCYMMQHIWDLAKEAYYQAYQVNNFNEDYCLSLADTYDVLEDADKAHEYYHKAISIAPKDLNIWIHYVEFLMDEENYSLALEILEEAQVHISDVILDYAVAAVLLESGQRQEGFVLLGKALTADFKAHKHFYQIAPTLKEDAAIKSLIMHYQ
jgi:tetratricopeptide (TPR) repeat protein